MTKLALAIILVVFAAPAWANEDWWYAESDNFRVYSSGGEDAAQTMATRLERLDQAMRLFTGVAAADGPVTSVAKPTIFQFGKTEDIGRLAGADWVAGFFIPRAGDSVAFVPLELGREFKIRSSPGTRDGYTFYDYNIPPEGVLFHEYAHYFMYQHAPAAYPPWYVEGLAELFGKLSLTDDGFALGDPPEHRMGEMSLFDVDTQKLFASNARASQYIDYPLYAHGWLATSYLSFEPSRQGQLATYLRLMNQGVDPPDAARQAFGDLGRLERELNAYRRQRARGISARFASQDEPDVATRRLGADEAARMDLHLRSSAGVSQAEARRLVPQARDLVARFPRSRPVLEAAIEAEFDAGNLAEAGALARKAIALQPDAVAAHLYLGKIAMEHAAQDRQWLETARKHFVDANRIDNEEPNALTGYYLTHRLSDGAVPEDALIALESAYRSAPFDPQIRRLLAHMLLLEERDGDARTVLSPLVYRPHGGRELRKLREMVEQLGAGGRDALIEELAPKLD